AACLSAHASISALTSSSVLSTCRQLGSACALLGNLCALPSGPDEQLDRHFRIWKQLAKSIDHEPLIALFDPLGLVHDQRDRRRGGCDLGGVVDAHASAAGR